jgi:glyoxylate/hydroxypyruvate reductase
MSILLIGDISDAEYETWRSQLALYLPESDSIVLANQRYDASAVDVAIVANPPVGSLAKLHGLRFIQSLWAGVDRLLSDPSLPVGVPIARLIDPAMTQAMVECAISHCFFLHRQMPAYLEQQTARKWRQLPQRLASECRIGVLGMGTLGYAVARALARLHFPVAGWSLSPKDFDVPAYQGSAGLEAVVGRSDILINLLPLTAQTQGILNGRLFQQLPRGAALINLARGRHLVEQDLLPALENCTVSYAILDVFAREPLPADHPFWTHPRILVMPHVASDTDPTSAARLAAENIAAFRAGGHVSGLVVRARGY